jgi:iron complex outermembrane recepter protein
MNVLTRKTLWIAFYLSISTVFSQTATIEGNVKDATTFNPLAVVNIQVQGTNVGTTTDINGFFKLDLKEGKYILNFSYVGYQTKSMDINLSSGERKQIELMLDESILSSDQVTIVGTRRLNRTSTETAVPVDIIMIKDVVSDLGQMDVNQILQYVTPSFNSNKQSGSDGADHIDPATLRGLGPDQTLVLINGKRRHQSALINIFGSRGRGNTGTDLNSIPVSAIDRIEVLRDGASAQYGSDAIAGVINIVLKSSVEKLSASFTAGANSADAGSSSITPLSSNDGSFDGETTNFSANYGFNLNNKGFANFSFDYLTKEHTNRPANPAKFDIYREKFGNAKSENFALFLNSKLEINNNSNFYIFGGINNRLTDAFAWTRTASENRNIPAIYPNGFNPQITSNISDQSLSIGLKTNNNGWDIDFNNTYGQNRFHYIIEGTLNASLLEKSPTRFDAGGFSLSQNTTSINVSKYYDDIAQGANIAFGFEYRIENYEIFAGEEGSWRNYGLVDTVINNEVSQIDRLGRPGGSQGFPGFQPSDELDETRANFGAYFDTEFDFTDKFMLGTAFRFERYSDFGNTINGKIALSYKINDNIVFRSSASSGFRAPSLAQINFSSTFTDFVSGNAIDKIIARNNSPITRRLGIPELKEETATNLSTGFTYKMDEFSASLDLYHVEINDRIVLTGAFEDTDPDIGADLQQLNVGAAQFFTNAIDTRTTGLDLVLNWSREFSDNNRLRLAFVSNFNNMKLGDITTSAKLKGKENIYFGSREQKFLLASAPKSKLNFTVDYLINEFNINARVVRFSEVTLEDWLGTDDIYKAAYVIDLTLGYKFNPSIAFKLGVANLFNTYPSEQDTETETGGLWDSVQMGINGRFLFSKVMFDL